MLLTGCHLRPFGCIIMGSRLRYVSQAACLLLMLLIRQVAPAQSIPHIPKGKKDLYWYNKHLGRLSARMFCNSSQLERIRIRKDNLAVIDQEAFQCLGQLDSLTLCQCQINQLPEGVFKPLSKLGELHLKSGYIFFLCTQVSSSYTKKMM